jgi:ATP-binding protein involved in chromosome partitioning
MELSQNNIEQLLQTIVHPATGKDIVTSGLVENIQLDGKKIRMRLVFPQPDPLSASLKKEIETRVSAAFPEAEIKGNILELVRE